MRDFEQQIRVLLQFQGMEEPVEVSVPWSVLRYLDTHAERSIAADGTVIYRQPRTARPAAACRPVLRERALAVA